MLFVGIFLRLLHYWHGFGSGLVLTGSTLSGQSGSGSMISLPVQAPCHEDFSFFVIIFNLKWLPFSHFDGPQS